jgi:hypothetical protein
MTQVSASSLTDIEPLHVATEWLRRFSVALTERDAEALLALIRGDAYWRDIVAFTGHIRTMEGRDRLVTSLLSLSDRIQPQAFRLADDQTPPSVQLRGLEQTIEFFFDFETADTIGKGIVRLTAGDTRAETARALDDCVVRTLSREAISAGVAGLLDRTPTERRIMTSILRDGAVSEDELIERLSTTAPTEISSALALLMRDGAIVQTDGVYSMAHVRTTHRRADAILDKLADL